MEREIGFDDQMGGDAGPVELVGDAEEMFLILDLEHNGVRALGHGLIGRRLSSGVADLGGLQPSGEVGPDDHVVEKGTPRNRKGGKWGNGRRGVRVCGGRVRVQGPRIGSNAVVVRSS